MKVVVVESPAKAKTINKYLGNDYKVVASYGHVRDLPAKDGSVLPDSDFAMSWEVDGKSEKHMKSIVQAVRGADSLFLATDPDREGEAISWHVNEVLKSRRALKRLDVKRHFAGRARSTVNSSTPIWPAGRSITSSALPCHRCSGASCRAAVLPGASNPSPYA
jgi:hypothetical protein